MLPSTADAGTRISRRVGVVVLLVAVVAIGAPTIYLMNAPQARASRPPWPISLLAAAPAPTPPTVTNKSAAASATSVQRVEYIPQPSEQEEKVLQALDELVQLDIDEMSLSDAMDYVSMKADIGVHLDERSLADAAIESSTPITFHSSKRTLRSSLRQILGQLDLTFFVADDVLTITTPEKAESTLVTRTYPVADLADARIPAPAVNAAPTGPFSAASTEAKAVPKAAAEPKNGYERLTEVIKSTLAPDSWTDDGGRGAIAVVPQSKSLVISQTHAGHDAVLQLLRSLRAARALADDPNAELPRRAKSDKQREATATPQEDPATAAETPSDIPNENPDATQEGPADATGTTPPADNPLNPTGAESEAGKGESAPVASAAANLPTDPTSPPTRTGPAKRLVVTELDPVTGHISWPTILRASRYAKQVGELDEIMKVRANSAKVVGGKYNQIRTACDRLQGLLQEHIGEYESRDYLEAIRFVDGLRLEANPREP